ncbi:MAG: hypothetical protein IPJ84_10690 [Bdellovibrionales bacterium]|nr:hypothetical protein [Bdellovibrionales bacterium]
MQELGRIEFRLNSSRLAGAAFRFLVLALSSYLLIGLFYVLAARFDPMWWIAFTVSLVVLWPVAIAGRRVVMMLLDWPALVIDQNEIVDRRGIKPRRWSLCEVDVLSPEISSLWNKPEAMRLAEVALDLEGYFFLTMQKKGSRALQRVFSDYIELPAEESECDGIRSFMSELVTRYGFRNQLLVGVMDDTAGEL